MRHVVAPRLAAVLAALAFALGGLAPVVALAQETVVDLDGEVDEGGADHVRVPFEVPEGTLEIEIAHDDLSDDNILDWGLDDPNGFRGWGGGNGENIVVTEEAASRSYLAGPIPAGTWYLVIGKAKLAAFPATYSATVTMREEPTLAPQPERQPYVATAALEDGTRWYAGDLHVHSRESGDARPPLDEIAEFARSRGLDFVELSDHNTTSQLDFIVDAQSRHDDLLMMPGVEYTTYDGHANGIGATVFVDHKIGLDGLTIDDAVEAFHEQGALVSVNHPTLDLGLACIGCAWTHDVPPASLAAVEIATGGAYPFFLDSAIAFWDGLCDQGAHLAAIGGSDDHKAGQDLDAFQDPMGEPTTMVRADRLDVASIVEAIRQGKTVVRVTPDEPMVELASDPAPDVDTIAARRAVFTATITGPFEEDTQARFVVDGEPQDAVTVDADPFTLTTEIEPSANPEDERRVRVEVLVSGDRRVITSHLWLRAGDAEPGATTATGAGPGASGASSASGAPSGSGTDGGDAADGGAADDEGCDCRTAGRAPGSYGGALVAALAVGLAFARRRARR
jgi:hypothetical protein